MSFFYGNINQHIARTNFQFAATYPSRRAMQEDENNYWLIKEPPDGVDVSHLKYNYEVLENEYVLVDYTKAPIFPKPESSEVVFNINKADDASFIDGDTFEPGNYHYTVWQKQKIHNDRKPEYVAIARIHSILPTFETWGTHHIDILESLSSDPNIYGGGKNLFGTNKTWKY